jgi:hypothetical protein
MTEQGTVTAACLTARLTAKPGMLRAPPLQQPLQFFRSHPDVGKNSAKRSSGHITTLVHRDGRAASISVPHDVVAAADAGHLEASPL